MQQNKIPPYNTGKVLIGSRYQPKQEYVMSDFEYRLQESMLNKENRAYAGVEVLCWVASVGLLSWLFVVAR